MPVLITSSLVSNMFLWFIYLFVVARNAHVAMSQLGTGISVICQFLTETRFKIVYKCEKRYAVYMGSVAHKVACNWWKNWLALILCFMYQNRLISSWDIFKIITFFNIKFRVQNQKLQSTTKKIILFYLNYGPW